VHLSAFSRSYRSYQAFPFGLVRRPLRACARFPTIASAAKLPFGVGVPFIGKNCAPATVAQRLGLPMNTYGRIPPLMVAELWKGGAPGIQKPVAGEAMSADATTT